MEKMRELTLGVRQNQREVGDFLKDLDSWTTDIKKQDHSLKTMKPREQAVSSLPPVRTKHITETVKNRRKTEKEKMKKEKIKSGEYRKWDQLDIDQMCDEIDKDEEAADIEVQVEIDKLDQKRREKVALEMKQKGNEHFKNKGYNAAIECYTTGMQADSSNPVFPANRAMAYLLLRKYSEAETDCTLTLSLDPSYTKAYLRRGTARIALGKTSSAKKDFLDALKLEPSNPQAKAELKKIDNMEKGGNKGSARKHSLPSEKSAYVYPVLIPANKRSKKPLLRVEIEEIGFNDDVAPIQTTKTEMDFSRIDIGIKSSEASNARNGISSVSTSTKPKKLIEELVPVVEAKDYQGDLTSPGNIEVVTKTPSNKLMANGYTEKSIPEDSVIPGCPTTSFQFQAHVKALGNSFPKLYTYLLQITPESIPSLLKQQLETETLVPILKCLKLSTDLNLVHKYLIQFSKTRRFDMTIMFMSDEEKDEVKSLFAKLKGSIPGQSSDLDALGKKYGIA